MPAQVIETKEAEAGERGKCWSERLKQAGEAALLHARVIGGELGEAVQERYVIGASLVLLL